MIRGSPFAAVDLNFNNTLVSLTQRVTPNAGLGTPRAHITSDHGQLVDGSRWDWSRGWGRAVLVSSGSLASSMVELVNEKKPSKKAEIVWTIIIIGCGVFTVGLIVCAMIFHWDLGNAPGAEYP